MINAPKVLIIDDSTTACHYMAQALQKVGYQVLTATDGQEGMMMLFQEHPHCLILDVLLPGMSGFALCRQLRSQDALRGLPIIMVSTKNTHADQAWGLRQGANRYLPKPFTEETLIHAVEEVLPGYMQARPPVAPRVVQGSAQPRHTQDLSGQAQAQVPLLSLIPRAGDGSGLKPRSASIADKHARLIYTAIDGHKNIEMLCAITRLDAEEIVRALQFLLAHRYIQLYEPGGKLVDSQMLFPHR